MLMKQINDNIRDYISGANNKTKLFVYSTHDSKVAMLLHAFGLFNGNLIPPGASLILELHENLDSTVSNGKAMDRYSLKFYYYNETYTNDFAYQLKSDRICEPSSSSCPVEYYLQQMASLEPSDIKYECGLSVPWLSYYVVNYALYITNAVLAIAFTFCWLYSR